MKDNSRIEKYINNKDYLIYEKSLRYKNGTSRIYYLIVNNNEIIDVLKENEVNSLIIKDRLSSENIDLIVYKVVRCEGNRYYSFRIRGRIEYRLNELIEVKDSIGMFFCKDKLGTKEHFDNGEESVILKVKVKIDDLIGGNEKTFQFKRCIPLEVV